MSKYHDTLNLSYENRHPPVNELERQLAVIYCRLNSWCHPLDGSEITNDLKYDRDSLHHRAFDAVNALVPDEVQLWMWNEGKEQWARSSTDSERIVSTDRVGSSNLSGPATL